MAILFRREAARRDLIEHYVYLAENAGPEIADRFLARVDDSFSDLMEHPEVGAPLALRRPELAGLRKWKIKGFDKFLIFCLPRPDGVLIVRVLHAAQDWWGLLGVDG
jgi:toxin ParE1/3/4